MPRFPAALLAALAVAPTAVADVTPAGLADLTIECRVTPNRVGAWDQYCGNSGDSPGPFIAHVRVPTAGAAAHTYQWTWNGAPPTAVFGGCTTTSTTCAVHAPIGQHTATAVATDPTTGRTRTLTAWVSVEPVCPQPGGGWTFC